MSYKYLSPKYAGTLEFVTSKDPLESFDKVKAMSAALGKEIELTYRPVGAVVAVDAQSTKGAFAAAVKKQLDGEGWEGSLIYKPDFGSQSTYDLISESAREIANKTGARVVVAQVGSWQPQTKKPAAQMRHQS
jgi:hypothetical protein